MSGTWTISWLMLRPLPYLCRYQTSTLARKGRSRPFPRSCWCCSASSGPCMAQCRTKQSASITNYVALIAKDQHPTRMQFILQNIAKHRPPTLLQASLETILQYGPHIHMAHMLNVHRLNEAPEPLSSHSAGGSRAVLAKTLRNRNPNTL